MSPVSIATSLSARIATRSTSASDALPHAAAISTAAAASTASPLAIANARALSARVTRPAPSAQLRHALFAARILALTDPELAGRLQKRIDAAAQRIDEQWCIEKSRQMVRSTPDRRLRFDKRADASTGVSRLLRREILLE